MATPAADKFLFNLNRRIGWRLAPSLIFALALSAGMWESRPGAVSKFAAPPAQDQNSIAAQKGFDEGIALRKQGTAESLSLAIKKFEEALRLWRSAGDRTGEAFALKEIGAVYNSLGESRKALESYNQALPLWRETGNRLGEAVTLNNIGIVYNTLGENQKALESLNQGLSLHRAIGNRNEEATTLFNIGNVYKSLGDLRKSLDLYTQSLSLFREVGASRAEAILLTSIGAVHNSLGENQQALDFHNQALPLLRAAGDRRGEATTLVNTGAAYNSLGEWRKALDLYNQALPLQREIGDRPEEARTLNNIGNVYISLGENQKALDSLDQALALFRAVGERRGEAFTLSNQGGVYMSLGENQKALDRFTLALPLLTAVGDRIGEAQTLNNIGRIYELSGEWQKALDYLNQAAPLFRAAGDRAGEATTRNNIGRIYDLLGEWRKALDLYNQALPLHRANGDRPAEARMFNNIGAVYDSLGEKQKALEFLNQGLNLFRDVGDRVGEATTLSNISDIYTTSGETQKALDLLNQALSLFLAVEDRSGEARTLYRFGFISFLKEEWRKGLDYFTQALPIFREIQSRDGEIATLGAIAEANRALGHFEESRSHIESALKIIESQRVKVVSKELRASYFATVESYYKSYIDLLMRLHGLEPKSGHMAAALEASERARARSLLESLAEARADIRRGADPKLLERERSLQQRLNAQAEEALKLSKSRADKERLAMGRREIDALTIELQQVQTQIRQTSPRYGALTQPQPLTLDEIQRQALDADTLLLEYSLGKERSFLWAVTPTTINSYELPKREEVEAAAQRAYKLLSADPRVRSQTARPGDSNLKEAGAQNYLTAAAALSRTLLAPVAGQLGKKRLLIVADGMLHYIPFGALPDPNSIKEGDRSWQPLIVDHEIVNLPSASTIAALRRELKGRKPAPKTLAALADPVFSRDDERIKPGARSAAQASAQPNPLDESIVRQIGQNASDTSAPNDLRVNRLPFTRREVEQIMALVPAGAGMKALDFEASRATATSERLSQYRYLHFSTHGLADSERPELSAIVLSLFDEQGRPLDGFLRAHEIYNLELPAELVTLNACKTGLGKLTRGEGLVSLTRGFMYAGAARVVVSLWSVSERASAELMTKFYRRMLVDGERPAAALRAAQVEMWRSLRWEEPFFWAAFTLQGEWR
jgi:CHAT domain-containing protein/Tfp pilus assembly protein PilF